jgi:aryl-alcohol dehydrogenase-like predicted oxidoreductase
VGQGVRAAINKLKAGRSRIRLWARSPYRALMNSHYSRRQFVRLTSLAAGAATVAPGAMRGQPAAAVRTAVDEVTLGNTGVKLSRLGMGTGSMGGQVQTALGKQGFIDLVHYAYDQGIRYFDCAEAYSTFGWVADAIRGLPREKLFIQSKIDGKPADVLGRIDRHRQNFKSDYVDSMLIHCMVRDGWTDEWKRVMDSFDAAKEKQWIRAKGVSCHDLPALRAAVASDWTEVHLVRVNPQGAHVEGLEPERWNRVSPPNDVTPVLAELKTMRAKGRGVIGMKIIGNGQFVSPEDREKSIRFAMSRPELDAVVIGFKSTDEVDEAITRMNRALAEAG